MKRTMLHHELNVPGGLKNRLIRSVREVVFGMEDGIVSTMGAITGIAAGTKDAYVVVLAGFVIIFVESLSMAAGTYLSSKSEREMEQEMLREEAQEIEEKPEAERLELIQFYSSRGFTPEEVDVVVRRVTSDKKLWLEEMAYRELGLIPHRQDTSRSQAVFMGLSYILGGLTPVIPYLLFKLSTATTVSIIASVTMLFIVGYIKGIVTHTRRVRSGIEMTLVSLSAAGVGFLVGRLVSFVL